VSKIYLLCQQLESLDRRAVDGWAGADFRRTTTACSEEAATHQLRAVPQLRQSEEKYIAKNVYNGGSLCQPHDCTTSAYWSGCNGRAELSCVDEEGQWSKDRSMWDSAVDRFIF